MRPIAAATFVLLLAALIAAQFEASPWWHAALYALPLTATLFLVAGACLLIENLVGAAFRSIAPALALFLLALAGVFSWLHRAPGTLPPGHALLDLPEKAESICALGAMVGALGLAIFGLRAPRLVSQLGSALAIGGVLFLARQTASGWGLPFLSTFAVAVVAGSLVAFAISAWMRRRAEGSIKPC